jgi:cell fate regulator YaaT (PSP1 superfamily)
MSCNSCSTNKLPGGCKNNGLCGISGCNKLTVVDWLGNISLPETNVQFSGVEIRFKNARKEFFRNENKLKLYIGDIVVVQVNDGHDVGVVSLTGDLVKVQMNKKTGLVTPDLLPVILRKASNADVEKWEKAKSRESETMFAAREKALELNLSMKISDVEYQGDAKKAIFYYTAEDRIDFRELVVKLAAQFKVKIELKQIGMRQEASHVGGIGSCGRELCCSTWLTDLKSVSTSAARYQQLSLNPEKLAGQCGKLKCCLNYELDGYMDALKEFPDTNKKLKTVKGNAIFQKMDIFKRTMTYTYTDEPGNFITLPLDEVLEIIRLNKKGETAPAISNKNEPVKIDLPVFKNVVGQDSLTRFDTKSGKKKRKPFSKRKNRKTP